MERRGGRSAALGCYRAEGLETKARAEVSVVRTKLRREAPSCTRDPPRIIRGVSTPPFFTKAPPLHREKALSPHHPTLPTSPASHPLQRAGRWAEQRDGRQGGARLLSSLSPASLCFLSASEEGILGAGSSRKGGFGGIGGRVKAKVEYQ